jgi:hypothetical protein
MNITQHLDAVAAVIPTITEAKNNKVISSCFYSVSFHRENKTKEELIEALNWFLDGGKFTSHWKEEIPFRARKNSKKREKTTWFNVQKNGIEFQLGHTTIKNYVGDFWERGAEALVRNALCSKEGGFSYYNHSFVKYVLERGAVFEDLGEWK